MNIKREVYISVDVETSGPIPGEFSMLTIGACDAYQPEVAFECSIKPTTLNADPEALAVTGLSLAELARDGLAPEEAMRKFGEWVATVVGEDGTPVFVGFNAPFDWSFVNYYFWRYAGSNPFGFSALDIKSLYMGAKKSTWKDTRSSNMKQVLGAGSHGTHDALEDARFQAELFRLILAS
ncbi:3'-5' exonuclease [Duganella sp. FT135W]|uniref:3'-5' exonuclease n=1 Tax=Duganella flavida TaxID=2692175 RepID=A0A6L8KKJ4_9BURK|nr:3'-5' exonuclease [Duganella flavida]MYM26302.1 3'-5' exonuclease [Duganella flavida]